MENVGAIPEETIIATIIAERGYLVLFSADTWRPGDVIEEMFNDIGGVETTIRTSQRFYILKETDGADFDAQAAIVRRFKVQQLPARSTDRHYRVSTD